jgi:hypothetical protein
MNLASAKDDAVVAGLEGTVMLQPAHGDLIQTQAALCLRVRQFDSHANEGRGAYTFVPKFAHRGDHPDVSRLEPRTEGEAGVEVAARLNVFREVSIEVDSDEESAAGEKRSVRFGVLA